MSDSKALSTLRFLEKLKAGLGAAGLAAILADGLLSSAASSHLIGSGASTTARLSGIGIVTVALIVFFVVSYFTDLSDDEVQREIGVAEPRKP